MAGRAGSRIMVSPSSCVDGGGCSTAKAAPHLLTLVRMARNGGASPLWPAAGKVTHGD